VFPPRTTLAFATVPPGAAPRARHHPDASWWAPRATWRAWRLDRKPRSTVSTLAEYLTRAARFGEFGTTPIENGIPSTRQIYRAHDAGGGGWPDGSVAGRRPL